MNELLNLRKCFAYMFCIETVSFQYYAGWIPLLASACEQINTALGADKREFHWTALETRDGQYRMFYRMAGDGNASRINTESTTFFVELPPRRRDAVTSLIADSVAKARAVSAQSCIACGVFVAGGFAGHVPSLCLAHEQLAPTWWQGSHNLLSKALDE